MLVWILRKQTDEPEKVVSYGVLPVLLGTSLCVVIRGFSAKLSVLEKIPDYQSQGHISAKGCRASLLLASICPLQEGNDAPCIVFYMGIIPMHNVVFKGKRALGLSLNCTQVAVPEQGYVWALVLIRSRCIACCLTCR